MKVRGEGLWAAGILLLAGVIGFAAGSSPEMPARWENRFSENEVLVRFAGAHGGAAAQQLHGEIGATVVHTYRIVDNLVLVKLPSDVTVEEAIWHYVQSPNVLYAEPNWRYHTVDAQQPELLPNDPDYGRLWAMPVIDAPAAWSITTGSQDVVVFVIDTGGDPDHEDLEDNTWEHFGYNAITDDNNPWDDNGHGTHVAGTIGAVGDNDIGIVGVNWTVTLGHAKFLDAGGGGWTSDAVKCLEYIWDQKVNEGLNVVATNNSWGGGGYSDALLDAIVAHREAGILFIAAAGNAGRDMDGTPEYPAGYRDPGIIAVAATGCQDNLACYSNYGKRSVHIGAPGSDIYSTLPGNEYASWGGTSMAAPHVTGVVALLAANDAELEWWELRNLVLAGGDEIPATEETTITGRRLNAYGALTCSDETVEAVLQPTGAGVLAKQGDTLLLEYLAIDCAAPAQGPIFVTISGPVEDSVELVDDGTGPDLAAADGIFAGYWTVPGEYGTYQFSFPNGQETIVTVLEPLDLNAALVWPSTGWWDQRQADEQLMNILFGEEEWGDYGMPWDGVYPFLPEAGYEIIFLTATGRGWSQLAAYLLEYRTEVEAFVADGGRLFINCAPDWMQGMDVDLGFGGVMLEYDPLGWDWDIWRVSAHDPEHPVFQGPALPMATEYEGDMGCGALRGPLAPILVGSAPVGWPGYDFTGDIVLGERTFGFGKVLFGSLGPVMWQNPSAEAFNLRVNAVYYTATCEITTHTITASAGEGGTIDPAGEEIVGSGDTRTFTITPNAGYVVDDVTIDDDSVYDELAFVNAVATYTFVSVTDDHTIHATFTRIHRADKTFGSGWNMLSVPVVDKDNDDPHSVFSSVIEAGHPLIVWEWIPESSYLEPESIDPGRGYWVYLSAGLLMEVTGHPPEGDYVVSLEAVGWHQVSTPMWPVAWQSLTLNDGTETKNPAEAVSAGWIDAYAYWWEPQVGDYVATFLPTTTGALDPWVGYWIKTETPDLTLTLPLDEGYVPAPPGPLTWLRLQDLPAGLRMPPPPPQLAMSSSTLTITAYPNPLREHRGVMFQVGGMPAQTVRVAVYDLSGQRVFLGQESGHQLLWDATGVTGRPVANGLYLYTVTVQVGDQWLTTPVGRLLILR